MADTTSPRIRLEASREGVRMHFTGMKRPPTEKLIPNWDQARQWAIVFHMTHGWPIHDGSVCTDGDA